MMTLVALFEKRLFQLRFLGLLGFMAAGVKDKASQAQHKGQADGAGGHVCGRASRRRSADHLEERRAALPSALLRTNVLQRERQQDQHERQQRQQRRDDK